MKQYLTPEFITGFMWFCVVQPALFFIGIGVFLQGVYQSIMGV
jgi:hypothetical protein